MKRRDANPAGQRKIKTSHVKLNRQENKPKFYIMKTKTLLLSALVTFCIILTSCEKNKEKSKSEYINLEYVDFFKLPDNKIVDSIASLLKTKSFTYEGIILYSETEPVEMAEIRWVKEGKKYANADSQSIILWRDTLDNLVTITYLYYRQSKTHSWNNDQIVLENTAKNLFSGFGFVQKPNEEYIFIQDGGKIKWYDIYCNQTFHTDTIQFPLLKGEVEGDTLQINYLMIPVWYTNLNDINTYLPDNEMENTAKNFIIAKYGGNGYTMGDKGFQIVSHKLCKAFDTWAINERRRYIVYIDIQTGEIVFNTII